MRMVTFSNYLEQSTSLCNQKTQAQTPGLGNRMWELWPVVVVIWYSYAYAFSNFETAE